MKGKGRKEDMRRNRKNSIKKERVIMIASSAFVLAALTMTGLYMKDNSVKSKDDGYTLDFTALEDSADDKFQELAENEADKNDMVADNSIANKVNPGSIGDTEIQPEVTENDLDYMPMEAGSSLIEIPGLTNQEGLPVQEDVETLLEEAADMQVAQNTEGENKEAEVEENEAASGKSVIVDKELSFSEENGLVRPVSGEILMHYSMDSSIYFATLDQYKYNPAVMIAAAEGTSVIASAEGKVIDIFEDAEIGNAVTIDLGNGYQATYGQLKDITVSKDEYVNEGEVLGVVAAPTKYYSVEGSNLYFKLTKDDSPVNPEGLFE